MAVRCDYGCTSWLTEPLIPIAATAKAVEELLKKVDELNVEI